MELKNVSILNLMSPNLAADRNVKMMAEAFDGVLRDIIKQIPEVAIIPNLVLDQIVNETLIDLLAWQFHVDFYEPTMPIETKRDLVMKSLDWHTRKGTPSVVEEIVSTVFSRAKIQEWFNYGGLPYRFRIGTEEEIPNEQIRSMLIRAINSVKNTRSYLDEITSITVFKDEIPSDDFWAMEVNVNPTDSDSITQSIFRNGRILRDGTTVFDTVVDYLFRNGAATRNGSIIRNMLQRVPAVGTVEQPVYRRFGMQDTLHLELNDGNYVDEQEINDFTGDTNLELWLSDRFEITETLAAIALSKKEYRSSLNIEDMFVINGSSKSNIIENFDIREDMSAGLFYHFFRDGARDRNGTIQRKGMVFIPLE